MQWMIRMTISAGFIAAVAIPRYNAPAQTPIAPDTSDGSVQQWEGPHGTTTCHDACSGANCCPTSSG